MIADAFELRDAAPTALGALAAEIRPQFQGRGLADTVLGAMAELARNAGLSQLIAPVRPSLKDRYPITPIERYVTWTRDNGEPFDPWIRVHVRRGATIARPIPTSMRITGTVGEWEQWTGMQFPEDGQYTFPAGLAPSEIDRGRDRVLLGAQRLDRPPARRIAPEKAEQNPDQGRGPCNRTLAA